MSLKKILKVTGLGLILLAASTLLNSVPVLASPQPPVAHHQAVLAAPAAQGGPIELCADDESTITMPDGAVVNIWGFGLMTGSGCVVQLPGPELRVSQGSTVTINLTNNLDAPTSILFPGLTGVTAQMTNGSGNQGIFTLEANPGETVQYTFEATHPGTYLYESGSDVETQLAMGLYGALIVEPATPGAAYNQETVLVLSEIDPCVNNGGCPDFGNMLDYHPTYWLINGRAFPQTLDPAAPATSQPYSAKIEANSGETTLVRYLNAGAIHHTMATLGLHQRLIAKDADELAPPLDVVGETIASGQTADVLITADGAVGDRFPIYNRQFHLTNGTLPANQMLHSPGGMMTFVEITGAAPSILNLTNFIIEPYGGSQAGNPAVTVSPDGSMLTIQGNGWKKIALSPPYNVVHSVSASTVLEFEFKSTAQGEIHGIGFDTDNSISPDRTFQLYGTQTWGLQDYHNYNPVDDWKLYKILVGQFYTGLMPYLVFSNDHDVASPTAVSMFRNIRIYEEPPPPPPTLRVSIGGSDADLPVVTYGGSQDANPTVTIEGVDNRTLKIVGNGWKKVALPLPYPVTANTTITFNFESSALGEIHGIGFDVDDNISPNLTYQLYGSQNWGIQTHHNYSGAGVQSYSITVGPSYAGVGSNMLYLTFANDHDVANPTAESIFSNISIQN